MIYQADFMTLLGHVEEATRIFEKCLKLHPDNAYVNVSYGHFLSVRLKSFLHTS